MSNFLSSPLQEVSVPTAQPNAQGNAQDSIPGVVRIVVGMLPCENPHSWRANPGRAVVDGAASLGIAIEECTVERLYFLSHNPGVDALSRLSSLLLADPVTESASWSLFDPDETAFEPNTSEVAYRPCVTDVPARELPRGLSEISVPNCEFPTVTCSRLARDLDTSAF